MAKHHYVPRCLLKGFVASGRGGGLHVMDLHTGKISIPKLKDAFAFENDNATPILDGIAGYPLQLEASIGKHIEDPASRILKIVRDTRSDIEPSEKTRGQLLLFLAAQYLRTPSQREKPFKLGASVRAKIDGNSHVDSAPDPHMLEIMKASTMIEAPQVAGILNTAALSYLVAPDELEFVISDCPFIIRHDYVFPSNLGVLHEINIPGASLYLPISDKVCILLQRGPRPAARNELSPGHFYGYRQASPLVVSNVNRCQIIRAKSFACKSGDFNRHLLGLRPLPGMAT